MGYELLAAAVIEKALQDYKAALMTKNRDGINEAISAVAVVCIISR